MYAVMIVNIVSEGAKFTKKTQSYIFVASMIIFHSISMCSTVSLSIVRIIYANCQRTLVYREERYELVEAGAGLAGCCCWYDDCPVAAANEFCIELYELLTALLEAGCAGLYVE